MSHIFDGLQRSESELCDGSVQPPPGVTELLRNAERRAISVWETTVQTEPDTAESRLHSEAINRQKRLPVSPKPETPVSVESVLRDQPLALFNQVQSVRASLSPQSRLPSITDSESPVAEAFRLLGVRLLHLRRDRPLQKVLITSTIPQEGKSMVSANLACTLTSKTPQRILLLEGDLRRPSLSQIFGLGKNPGLSEWLAGERSLAASIYHIEDPNLWLLPSGSAPNNALELLQSGKLSMLMDQLTALFDWIIIDSPPVLPLADTSVWMRFADGILLTTRQGVTEKKQLLKGLEAIEPKKLIGALVNSSQNVACSGYYYISANIPQST